MSVIYHSISPTEQAICPLCLDSLKDNDPVAHTHGGEKHPLHRSCAKELAVLSNLCPCCGVPIDPDSLLTWKERWIVDLKCMKRDALIVTAATGTLTTEIILTLGLARIAALGKEASLAATGGALIGTTVALVDLIDKLGAVLERKVVEEQLIRIAAAETRRGVLKSIAHMPPAVVVAGGASLIAGIMSAVGRGEMLQAAAIEGIQVGAIAAGTLAITGKIAATLIETIGTLAGREKGVAALTAVKARTLTRVNVKAVLVAALVIATSGMNKGLDKAAAVGALGTLVSGVIAAAEHMFLPH